MSIYRQYLRLTKELWWVSLLIKFHRLLKYGNWHISKHKIVHGLELKAVINDFLGLCMCEIKGNGWDLKHHGEKFDVNEGTFL